MGAQTQDMQVRRTVGPVTGAATVGGAVGAAIAQVVVHVWPYLGPVETALTVLIAAALSLLGGWLVPPQRPAVVTPTEDPDVYEGRHVREGEVVAVPDPVDPVEGEDPVDPARRPGV